MGGGVCVCVLIINKKRGGNKDFLAGGDPGTGLPGPVGTGWDRASGAAPARKCCYQLFF